MNYFWPLLLQVLAGVVVFAEITLPSFGVLSALALALAGGSWYFILAHLPRGAAVGFGLADLVLVPTAVRIAFRYLGHSPISHRTDVGTGSGLEGGREWARLIGRVAAAETSLRPSGKIRLDGEIHEARTAGDFVEKDAPVRILAVRGHEFLVERPEPI